MSSSNKTLSLLTATALAAGLGMTASASALSMSDLAQGYLLAMTNGFMTGAIIDIEGGGLL